MRFQWAFIRHTRLWFAVSLLLVLLAVAGLAVRGLNYGIDFTGGTQMNLNFLHATRVATVDQVLARQGLGGSTVVRLGRTGNNLVITTPNISEAERNHLLSVLRQQVGPFQEISTSRVSSIVGRQTETKALIAVLIAIAAIILYITIRFELRFALAGILAMVHDVVVTVGLIALIHIQLSQYFIMAILTIFGYSITDKIIVFDRIRENLQRRRKQESFESMVDLSLNQVLVRSIYTSTTVLIALAALLAFAGSNIRDFSLTMFIGVAVGTYSSICIASPLWLLLRQREERRARPRAAS
ncbi:MAG: protein translocase subunit SecF [Firmicutes bacterium]|nr:protein translocase subunit SecF [Alicyclobacillaceae bacterium]MCL6496614.1 protein translocase subunit SecF [Bacillota bacterium]